MSTISDVGATGLIAIVAAKSAAALLDPADGLVRVLTEYASARRWTSGRVVVFSKRRLLEITVVSLEPRVEDVPVYEATPEYDISIEPLQSNVEAILKCRGLSFLEMSGF